jgi:hypothetical protein
LNETLGQALDGLAALIPTLEAPVARILTFHASEAFSPFLGTTPAPVVRLVRERLEPIVGPIVVAGGTNQNFVDATAIGRTTRPSEASRSRSARPSTPRTMDRSSRTRRTGRSGPMARLFGRPTDLRQSGDDRRALRSVSGRPGPVTSAGGRPAAGLLRVPADGRSVGRLAAAAASVTYYETTNGGIVERDAAT